MFVVRAFAIVTTVLLSAAPAYAQAAPEGPELLNVVLLGAGVVGLALGRFGSRTRGPRE